MRNVLPFNDTRIRVFDIHTFGRGNVLVVNDCRPIGGGFYGHFMVDSQEDPIIAVGRCPGEVYMKLVRMPGLARFAKDILNIRMTPLDFAI